MSFSHPILALRMFLISEDDSDEIKDGINRVHGFKLSESMIKQTT